MSDSAGQPISARIETDRPTVHVGNVASIVLHACRDSSLPARPLQSALCRQVCVHDLYRQRALYVMLSPSWAISSLVDTMHELNLSAASSFRANCSFRRGASLLEELGRCTFDVTASDTTTLLRRTTSRIGSRRNDLARLALALRPALVRPTTCAASESTSNFEEPRAFTVCVVVTLHRCTSLAAARSCRWLRGECVYL